MVIPHGRCKLNLLEPRNKNHEKNGNGNWETTHIFHEKVLNHPIETSIHQHKWMFQVPGLREFFWQLLKISLFSIRMTLPVSLRTLPL